MCEEKPGTHGRISVVEDLVAVAIDLESGEIRYVITYGRIQDPVDSAALEAIVLMHSGKFGLGGAARATRLCQSLREAAGAPYFFEALFDFSRASIPSGDDYESWRHKIDMEMREGRHLYYLGADRDPE